MPTWSKLSSSQVSTAGDLGRRDQYAGQVAGSRGGLQRTRTFSIVIGGFKFEVQRCNPEGCEKVAGGRSEAKTTG
jgi:hypothetical protein